MPPTPKKRTPKRKTKTQKLLNAWLPVFTLGGFIIVGIEKIRGNISLDGFVVGLSGIVLVGESLKKLFKNYKS